MEIDWGGIITTVVTMLLSGGIGGVITFFLFIKQRKKKEDADVVDKDASAASNMLEFTDKYQDFTIKMMNKFQATIDEKDKIIFENQKKLYELERTVEEHSKKIKNINNLFIGEQRRRQYAEKNICLVENCKFREPKKGLFKINNVSPDINE